MFAALGLIPYFPHGPTKITLDAYLENQRSPVSLQWHTEEDCPFSQQQSVNSGISGCFSSEECAAK